MALAATSVGCMSDEDAETSGEGGLDTVKGTYSAIAAYAPLFVAMEEGFFTKHGIKNEMDEVRINEALPLVSSGEYDWGRAENGPGWFNAINSGLDLYGVVDRLTYTCSADNTLVVSKQAADEGVDTFPELAGKSIGIIAPGTQGDYWLGQLLDEHGMSADDVKVVNLDYPDQLAAMASGNLDAAFMLEPLLTQGLEDGSIVPLQSMLEVTPGANIGTMIFGGKFIDREDGDVAARWIAAWLEAARFAQDPANRDATLAAVQKWTDMELKTLETIYDGKNTWPQVDVNGQVDADEVLS
ncbi:MAG: ABC transporter substrate-binding protein, partial [Gaiellales bacterium]